VSIIHLIEDSFIPEIFMIFVVVAAKESGGSDHAIGYIRRRVGKERRRKE